MGLTPSANKQINNCSGGEKRRITLSSELVADRKLLFLDEPEASLDEKTRGTLYKYLKKLAHKDQRALLVIAHDKEIINYCDKVLYMDKKGVTGQLVAQGRPEEVLKTLNVGSFSELMKGGR